MLQSLELEGQGRRLVLPFLTSRCSILAQAWAVPGLGSLQQQHEAPAPGLLLQG